MPSPDRPLHTGMNTAVRPLLYTYRRCPYAMRARMALLQTGVDYAPFEIVLRDKPAQMLAISPKGTVPVLVLPDGRVLEQSLDIVRWAFESTGDAQGWWARAQSPGNLALQAACDGPFKQHLDRTKYPERFADAQGREHHREQALTVLLQDLEARLRVAPQLGGDAPCATDMGIFPFVRQFAATDPQWWAAQPLPAVQAWLAQWLAHPLFERAMRQVPQASPGPRDQLLASGKLSSRFCGLSRSRPCASMARPR